MKFEFEIGNCAQAADDRGRFLRGREFDEQPIELRNPHVVDLGGCLLQQVETLLERKERLFLIVVRDRDDHFIKQFSRPLDHVEMAVSHGIKAAWINCASHDEENVQLRKRPGQAIQRATFNVQMRAACSRRPPGDVARACLQSTRHAWQSESGYSRAVRLRLETFAE